MLASLAGRKASKQNNSRISPPNDAQISRSPETTIEIYDRNEILTPSRPLLLRLVAVQTVSSRTRIELAVRVAQVLARRMLARNRRSMREDFLLFGKGRPVPLRMFPDELLLDEDRLAPTGGCAGSWTDTVLLRSTSTLLPLALQDELCG